ncbi:MAG: ABC transporter substrate-binding protein [Azospirillaceae bacterium]|nr:ABC transporter substrate-binding protein [Azospirillaceae bacterium]
MKLRLCAMACAMTGLLLTGPARSADLRIGTAAEPATFDPHFRNTTPDNSLRRHVFESLIGQDENQKLFPLLATQWRPIDALTWEFKLRQGVRFHDGTAFTAQDFIYTVCRIPNVPNSPTSFALYTRGIDAIETPDPYTLIIRTAAPYPLLPTELATFGIVSARAAGGMAVRFDRAGCNGVSSYPNSALFDDGTLAMGTGPFKRAEYVKGDRIVLVRNPDYWGPRPAWDRVIFRPLTADAPRVAALLAGDVDMIEMPPVQDLERLRATPGISVVQVQSNRTIFLELDQTSDQPRSIAGAAGRNPLKDPRVREALAIAINRDAIVRSIMNSSAVAASELMPPGFFGFNPAIHVNYDPVRSRQLLEQAGYPDGFELVLGTPNDRYIHDQKVAQAVAQMWTRIGVKTRVDASTNSIFFQRAHRNEFSASLLGWGPATGEMSSPLKAIIATPDVTHGFGTFNYGGYSNRAVDDLLIRALATIDDPGREALLAQAMKVAMDDVAVIPLHYELTAWALRSGLSYKARADQFTLATDVLANDVARGP